MALSRSANPLEKSNAQIITMLQDIKSILLRSELRESYPVEEIRELPRIRPIKVPDWAKPPDVFPKGAVPGMSAESATKKPPINIDTDEKNKKDSPAES